MKTKRRILIADPSTTLLDTITKSEEAKDYEIATAKTGPETLHTLQHFAPDLIVVDLMMPHLHGIEVIKAIRSTPQYSELGIIVTSYQVMIQNYHAAIEEGAAYFLVKPFNLKHFFQLITDYFNHALKPAPFSMKSSYEISQNHSYHPVPSTLDSYLRFWGTRGSSPVSGAEYVRYGGNTSCLEVRSGNDLVIIDAGTGLRELGDTVNLETCRTIHLFLSHTHWDHITGFPFFSPLYRKHCDVVIWSPVGFEKNTKELFTDMLAYAYFPVKLDEMKARVRFKELRDHQPIRIGDVTITCHFTNHPGPTLGFKVSSPTKTVGYITDNEVLMGYHGHPNEIHRKHPLLEPHLDLIEFLKDCDLIIHEAQYFPQEYHRKVGWGHSSIPNATVLVKYTGCKQWMVTHHDPNHKDHDLQVKLQLHKDILKECNLDVKVDIAYDGLILPF